MSTFKVTSEQFGKAAAKCLSTVFFKYFVSYQELFNPYILYNYQQSIKPVAYRVQFITSEMHSIQEFFQLIEKVKTVLSKIWNSNNDQKTQIQTYSIILLVQQLWEGRYFYEIVDKQTNAYAEFLQRNSGMNNIIWEDTIADKIETWDWFICLKLSFSRDFCLCPLVRQVINYWYFRNVYNFGWKYLFRDI